MKKFLKILAFIFTALFVYAAAVQYNDPDAVKWYAIYGLAALASLLFGLGKLRVMWAIILTVFYLGLTIYTWPQKFEGVTIGEGDIINIERGREALGLLIAGIMMAIYAITNRKS
ncbi:transmembrane 220 family protein [Croceitalea rosinachiae]|uniref:Transmembrane 220 family protein n=1 Tax=Croceitalea rosinachiae TaxID=3075596 RepID=A0ABU3AE93_9FLAO|nr:transmembrane 220 family protein [Croceitalea sp. F388]MDT0608500.1 transmembrane 220 family protein [Croceitalea sp. F388]